jgi:hypothetical protein
LPTTKYDENIKVDGKQQVGCIKRNEVYLAKKMDNEINQIDEGTFSK